MKKTALGLLLLGALTAVVIVIHRGNAPVSVPVEPTGQDPNFVPGEIVVGFHKDVAIDTAESLLRRHGVRFERTDDVNMGKTFFYETGAKFIVTVPVGEEQRWLDRFSQEASVKSAGRHNDPTRILVD